MFPVNSVQDGWSGSLKQHPRLTAREYNTEGFLVFATFGSLIPDFLPSNSPQLVSEFVFGLDISSVSRC